MRTLAWGLLSTTAAAALIAAAPGTASAQASPEQSRGAQTFNYDIPAQPLDAALRAFARASRQQILFDRELVKGKRSPAVVGSFSAEEAVARLLQGSGLHARRTKAGSWVVASAEGNGPGADSGAELASARSASSWGEDAVPEGQEGIAEILVVGSRSQNVDIRRTEDDPQPYVVFSKEEIEKSQAQTVEEFLRQRLPMNTKSASNSQSNAALVATSGNTSSINLRGLGPTQTLILIDGRRAPRMLAATGSASNDGGVGLGYTFGQADINGIPMSSIERIEVLPSTAGGIYGGGAVGGVINIIRKRDYKGIDIRVGFDGSANGGGEGFRIESSGGFSPDQGKTQVTFAISHSHTDQLNGEDNSLLRRGRALAAQNVSRPATGLFSGLTTNIVSAFGQGNLVLDNGDALNSDHTYVSVGSAGSAADLQANSGQYQTRLSNDSNGKLYSLLGGANVTSANVNVRRSVTRNIDLALDLVGSLNASDSTVGVPNSATLLADHPNNPFRQAISVYFPLPGLKSESRSRATSLAATVSSLIKLGHGWSLNAEYQLSRARNKSQSTVAIDSQQVAAAVADGRINPLRDLNIYSVDWSQYSFTDPRQVFPFETNQELVSARLSGKLLSLPAGSVNVTLLGEHRVERAAKIDAVGPTSHVIYMPKSQAINSAYAEAVVPIFSDRNADALLRGLDVQLSFRFDEYKTKATTPSFYSAAAAAPEFIGAKSGMTSLDYTIGARWSPLGGITFRASHGTGFLPPSIAQISPLPDQIIQMNGQTFVVDPRRGTQAVSAVGLVTISRGGNLNLKPEQSSSLSFGVIVQPEFIQGLRLSADYTRISKRDEIGSISYIVLPANENVFPGRVTRGPKLPTDPPEWLGPITEMDQSFINVTRSDVATWDFQSDFEFSASGAGEIKLYALATYFSRYRRQFKPLTDPFDSVGYVDGPLKWRGNAGFDWSVGALGIYWNSQFYSKYQVTFSDPVRAAILNPSSISTQGKITIPSQIYHDIGLRYDLGKGVSHPWLQGAFIYAGLKNLFNSKPPRIAESGPGYSTYGDPRLRRYTLTLRKEL